MNPHKYILPVVISSLTMSSATAFATDSNIRLHKLTVKLKAYYEGDHKFDQKNNGDEKESQKILTEKISTKEILEGLVGEGVINSIKGWSLHLATNDDGEVIGTYISKNKNSPINVTQYFAASSGTTIMSYKREYNDKKDIDKGTVQYRSVSKVDINVDDVEVKTEGIVEVNTSFSDETGYEQEFVKSADFSDASGTIGDKGSPADGLVNGQLKAANGKEFTLNN